LFEHPASHHPSGWAPYFVAMPVSAQQAHARVRQVWLMSG
jgi:hypothetical protein